MGRQIVVDLDKAVNILQGQGASDAHHIFKLVLVSGLYCNFLYINSNQNVFSISSYLLYRPMYGYHRKEHQLFKMYFYNPITRKHSYDLLLVSYLHIQLI